MRQILVQVPRGHGTQVLQHARELNGINLAQFQAQGDHDHQPLDMVIVHVANGRVSELLNRLRPIPDMHMSFFPQGVLALKPPADEAPQQVRDVEKLSPIEVFLSGVQSIGAWQGFLGYAAAAAVVVWIGLFTNTSYLLVAAMLIAPYAGPAMTAALATAANDGRVLARGVLRYCAALALSIVVAWLLSMLMGRGITTPMMVQQSQVSSVAVLLPLVAGAAGALNLVRSERDSLVSGAATGMLIAASLAPPAGLVGMAAAVGRWDMALDGLFVLALQLVGINFAGAIVFRFAGLSARGQRYETGWRGIFPLAVAVSLIGLALLVAVQFSDPIKLRRSSLAQRVAADIQQMIEQNPAVTLVEANTRFTRSDDVPHGTLLSEIYVTPAPGSTTAPADLQQQLTRTLQQQIHASQPEVNLLVRVTVLEFPSQP